MKNDFKCYIKIGIGIFIIYLCIHYWPSLAGSGGSLLAAASPLIVGCIIAYLVNILMSWYERHTIVVGTVSTIFSGVFNSLLTLIFALYLLREDVNKKPAVEVLVEEKIISKGE